MASVPLVAQADTVWSGTTGAWNDPANWVGGVVPPGSGTTYINSGTAQLGVGISGTSGSPFFKIEAGALSISGGYLYSPSGVYLGDNGNGTATVSSGTWAMDSSLYVGVYASGSLTISGGSVWSDDTYLGGQAGNATVVVTGGTWNTGDYLFLGQQGVGTASLLVDGGLVISQSVDIGYIQAASGTATVSSGTWAAGSIVVGTAILGSPAGTLRLNGGVLQASGVSAGGGTSSSTFSFDGGTLRATGNNANFVPGFSSGVTINSGGAFIDSNGNNIGISSAFNGTGTLTKQGIGMLTLTGSNSYTGGTTIRNGTLAVNSGGSINHGSAQMNVGTVAGQTGTLAIGAGGSVRNHRAQVGAGGSGFVTVSGSGATWTNTEDLYVGFSSSGSLAITVGGSVSADVFQMGLSSGVQGMVTVSGTGSLLSARQVFVASSGTGVMNLVEGGMLTVNSGSGTVGLARSNGSTGILNIGTGGLAGILNASRINTDSFYTTNIGVVNFNHTDNITFGTRIDGRTSVNKLASGTTTFTGSNAYSGSTSITGGKLVVNGVNSGTGAVSVANGAALAGSGTIAGVVTVADGGILTPGNSPGTLTVGGLILNSTSELQFELGTSSDLMVVQNNFTLDGILNVTNSGGFGQGTYTLFQYGGTLINNGLSFGTLPAGFAYALDLSQAGYVRLTVLPPDLYWDGPNTTPEGMPSGGSGTWNNEPSHTNWTTASGSANVAWSSSGTARFTGTAGTVNVAETINVKEMIFETDGYTISGTGALATTGPTLTVNTGTGLTVEIATQITGNGALVKTGTDGTLILSGSNNYSGGTSVLSGTLVAGANEALGTGGVVVENAALQINAGITVRNAITGNNGASIYNAGTIYRTGFDGGIDNNVGDLTVFNTGTIDAWQGIQVTGGSLSLENRGGVITGGSVGIFATSGTAGIHNFAGARMTSGMQLFSGSILNEGASSIESTLQISNGGAVVNTGTGTKIEASGYGILIRNGGTVENTNGALIQGSTGVWLDGGGSVTNSGAVITGTTDYGVNLDDGATRLLVNENGGTITGNMVGVRLARGGTVRNLAGSVITGLAPSSTSIFNGAVGGVVLENAGTLNGSVVLGVGVHEITLHTGSVVNGSLDAGSDPASILTLTGAGTQIYSAAVTGSTIFTGTLIKKGTGSWTIDQNFDGTSSALAVGVKITDGILKTSAVSALGTASGELSGGSLAPTGQLNLSSLAWTGGTLAMVLGTNTSFLNIAGNLTLTGTGIFDFTGDSGFLSSTAYGILSAANLSSFSAANFAGSALLGVTPKFFLIGNTLFVTFTGASTGPLIQNSGPVFTPTNADFQVDGEVRTGGPFQSNTIRSLTFADGSSLLVFNNLAVTSGNFSIPTGTATLSGGRVIVPGAFNLNGGGTLVAGSEFVIGGDANVNGGNLVIGGLFAAGGSMNIGAGSSAQVLGFLTVPQINNSGLLKGAGVITGNVVNNGIVAPGNSPGTLTVNGNYTQTGNGTLQIELGDLLFITGNASLAGRLQLLGTSKLRYGQQIVFLQAGSISGEFDEIVVPNPSQNRGRLLVDGGTGVLLIAPTSYTLVAETTNQQNVAKALDSYIPASGNDREVVSIALDLQSEDQYPAAFDQIAPTYYESLGNITIEQAFVQSQQLNQRLSAVRLGARGFQAIGISSPLVHDKDGKSVFEAKDAKKTVEVETATNWNIWAMGSGLFAQVTNIGQLPNYDFNSGGFLVGGDYRWSENFVSGLYGGYQYTWADAGDAGNTQINSALFGGYASYTQGGFYADGIVGGGYNGYRVRRGITFSTIDRTARSQPNGGQFNASLNLGYDWEIGKFTLGPIAGVQYTYAGIAPFSETGADSLDLRVAQQNLNSLRTTFGGRIAYTWNVTDKVALIPEVRMFWQHEFLNNPRNISSALDGGSGPTFGYETVAPARDSVFAGAGLSAQFGERWNAFVYWNVDFGRQTYFGNSVSAGVNWKF